MPHYLTKLQKHYAQRRGIPFNAVLGKFMGLRSMSSAYALMEQLKNYDFLQKAPSYLFASGYRFFE